MAWRVLSLAQFQELQVENKRSQSRNDVTDPKSVNNSRWTPKVQCFRETPSHPVRMMREGNNNNNKHVLVRSHWLWMTPCLFKLFKLLKFPQYHSVFLPPSSQCWVDFGVSQIELGIHYTDLVSVVSFFTILCAQPVTLEIGPRTINTMTLHGIFIPLSELKSYCLWNIFSYCNLHVGELSFIPFVSYTSCLLPSSLCSSLFLSSTRPPDWVDLVSPSNIELWCSSYHSLTLVSVMSFLDVIFWGSICNP